jgi:DNA-binding HxlR family transcriptional regulator
VSGPGSEVDPPTSREQDAVRILLIISAAATPLSQPSGDDPALSDAVGVVETQVKLQKLDFWVRNPDFLADELLNDYERSREPYLLDLAGQILDSEEPEVRRYPMLRFLFGAYEPLDDALAILRSAGLVVRRKHGSVGQVQRHDYFLTKRGKDAIDEILSIAPPFEYYVDRVRLVTALAEGYGGTHLKRRQYLYDEYRNAPIGTRIGSIAARARARLAEFRAAASVRAG